MTDEQQARTDFAAIVGPRGFNLGHEEWCQKVRKQVSHNRYKEAMQRLERCASVGPGGLQCGLEHGHSGSHTALIPTGYPWA